jgi:hypothetical protein
MIVLRNKRTKQILEAVLIGSLKKLLVGVGDPECSEFMPDKANLLFELVDACPKEKQALKEAGFNL